MPAPGALHGVRVLELAAVVAGPTAGQIMGDLGADVIKVEPPGGDAARHAGAAKEGVPLWWKHLGRSKRSIGIDLTTAAGRDILLDLVATADVLVESFRPGTLERWDLSPQTLLQANPDLVVARISGFGQHGPLASRPAFGTLIEAMSGFAGLNGQDDGPPTLPPIALADYLTGFAAAIGVLAALHARQAGLSRGQVVEVDLLRSVLAVMNLQIVEADQTGRIPVRIGSRMVTTAPRNVYRTADDRWLAVSGTTAKTAGAIMDLVGREDLKKEPWFASGAGRFAHVAQIDEAMAAWARSRPLSQAMAEANAAGATIAPVHDLAEVLADGDVAASGAIVEVDDPQLGRVRVPGLLCTMSETPGKIRWLGPALGSSTEQVLGELGWSSEKVAELRRMQVVA